jgi:hypothetical protein
LEEQVRAAQEEHDQTVEGMAEGEEEVEPTPPMQIPLEGFNETISTVPGGDRPQTASISLRGGKLTVEGEFKKGDVIELYVRAKVAEVHFVDTQDKFGEVVGTERKHVAKPIAVRRLTASEE